MKKYEAQDVSEADVTAILNPILKYVEEIPRPLEQIILYNVWKGENHTAFQTDILRDLGIDREELRKIIAALKEDGYISVEKVGNKVKLTYNHGLFRLKGVVENEEGKKIALKVLARYMKSGYITVRGKQEGEVS